MLVLEALDPKQLSYLFIFPSYVMEGEFELLIYFWKNGWI